MVVDDDPSVILVELLANHSDGEVGLLVQQGRGLRPGGEGFDLLPLAQEAEHVSAQLVLGRALGRSTHDDAVLRGLHRIEDAPQSLPLIVGQALGDAVGVGVGDKDDESAGQRHLLGEAGPFRPDRVLGDLAQDRLAGLEHLLDLDVGPRLGPARGGFEVFGIVANVAPVQHRVLLRADLDERGFHAGQHVLDPGEVDVAVDLGLFVGGPRHVVLEERATFEHPDLDGMGPGMDGHQVAAEGASVALLAPSALERGLVEFDRLAEVVVDAEVGRHRVVGHGGPIAAAAVRRRDLSATTAPLLAVGVAGRLGVAGGPVRRRRWRHPSPGAGGRRRRPGVADTRPYSGFGRRARLLDGRVALRLAGRFSIGGPGGLAPPTAA